MKKLVYLMLSVVLLLNSVATTALAADDDGGAHVHSYGNWTDSEDGANHQKQCSCGSIVKEAHNWSDWKVLVPATCNMVGRETRKCEICNATEGRTIPVDPHNHTPSDYIKFDERYHICVCVDCKLVLDKDFHSGSPATCQSPAECNICYRFYGSIGDHQYVKTEAKAPTCTEGGNNEYWTCSACDKVVKKDKTTDTTPEDEILKPTGHNFSDWIEVEAATEEHPGSEKRVCLNPDCNAFEGRVIPKLPHPHVLEKHDAVSATCTTDGNNEYYTCAKCSGKYYDKDANELSAAAVKIPATGHNWGEPTFTWADDFSSCKAVFICTNNNCGSRKTEDCTITSESTESTCKDNGKTVYTATVNSDGNNYTDTKDVTLPLVDHTYGNEIPEVAATCTENGTKAHFKCSICDKLFISDGEKYAEVSAEDLVISATGHKWGEPAFTWADDCSSCKAAFACTNNNCDYSETEDCTITSERVESTCKDTGKAVYTASVNFDGKNHTDIREVTLPLGDHTYGNEILEIPATCTENGTKAHFKCSVCDRIFIRDGEKYVEVSDEDLLIPATGHKWGKWVVTKESTCIEEGSRSRVCDNDRSHVETEVIAKKPVDPVKPADPAKPATGDAGVGVWFALMVLTALFGTAIVVRKRRA